MMMMMPLATTTCCCRILEVAACIRGAAQLACTASLNMHASTYTSRINARSKHQMTCAQCSLPRAKVKAPRGCAHAHAPTRTRTRTCARARVRVRARAQSNTRMRKSVRVHSPEYAEKQITPDAYTQPLIPRYCACMSARPSVVGLASWHVMPPDVSSSSRAPLVGHSTADMRLVKAGYGLNSR